MESQGDTAPASAPEAAGQEGTSGLMSSREGARRLEGACWLIVAVSIGGGAFSQSVLNESGPPPARLAVLVPLIFYVVAALVGVLLWEIRRQSRLELGLCWANTRLERKVAELTRLLDQRGGRANAA